MEAKLAYVVTNQEAMDAKQRELDEHMKDMTVKHDDMGTDLKAILELLKQKPYALGFNHLLCYLF